MVVLVMAMVQRLENSEEIVSDSVFGYGPYGLVLFGCLIYDSGKVATAAVFHENVESSSVSIDVASYNVVMTVFLRIVAVSRW